MKTAAPEDMDAPTPRRRQTRPWGKLCTLVVLFALALRVIYVPYHLAQEDHVGTVGHELSHVSAEHGHEHGHEHAPHSTLDHETELIAQRDSSPVARVELAVVPLEFGVLPAPGMCWGRAAPDPRPPESRQRPVARPRGPPTAV